MSTDRVQMKREEIVGDDVVLSDIFPKSNTKSINDSNAGTSLEETLDRIWNSINNKLSRIVNSVNGRTGVVVLNADDVGLGNVDNVSFADIKDWVIGRLKIEFNNKQIMLFDRLDEVQSFINENNDEAYSNRPFYSRHGFITESDDRGYIGYIYWDPVQETLKYECKVIDTVAYTNNSLIYNDDFSENGKYPEKDLRKGGLGVNIWKYEDALETYNDLTNGKGASGLRIKKDAIINNVYCFDNVYGIDSNDTNSFLYVSNSYLPTDAKKIDIYIDGFKIVNNIYDSLTYTKFNGMSSNYIRPRTNPAYKVNDIIICNFNADNYVDDDGSLKDPNMNPLLLYRQTAIGKFTQTPTLEHPELDYVIQFFTMKPNLYRGLKEYKIHTGYQDNVTSKAIGISLLENNGDNLSGINASAPYRERFPGSKIVSKEYRTITPAGLTDPINESKIDSSTFITPNYSLCVIPYDQFMGGAGTVRLRNWPMHDPSIDVRNGDSFPITSLLGINLIKYAPPLDSLGESLYAVNMSGLRVNSSEDALNNDWFGNDSDETLNVEPGYHSGGISINTGEFLEIGSFNNDLDHSRDNMDEYYDEGKLNVRVNNNMGLYNVDNKISIMLYDPNWNTPFSIPDETGKPIHYYARSSDEPKFGGLKFKRSLPYKDKNGVWQNLKTSDRYKSLSVDYGMGLGLSRYQSTGKFDSDEPQQHLGINAVDILNAKDYYDLIKIKTDGKPELIVGDYYTGLRFIPATTMTSVSDPETPTDDETRNILGIRVNLNYDSSESLNEESSTGESVIYNHKYRDGLNGIGISNNNVLSIQTNLSSSLNTYYPNKKTHIVKLEDDSHKLVYYKEPAHATAGELLEIKTLEDMIVNYMIYQRPPDTNDPSIFDILLDVDDDGKIIHKNYDKMFLVEYGRSIDHTNHNIILDQDYKYMLTNAGFALGDAVVHKRFVIFCGKSKKYLDSFVPDIDNPDPDRVYVAYVNSNYPDTKKELGLFLWDESKKEWNKPGGYVKFDITDYRPGLAINCNTSRGLESYEGLAVNINDDPSSGGLHFRDDGSLSLKIVNDRVVNGKIIKEDPTICVHPNEAVNAPLMSLNEMTRLTEFLDNLTDYKHSQLVNNHNSKVNYSDLPNSLCIDEKGRLMVRLDFLFSFFTDILQRDINENAAMLNPLAEFIDRYLESEYGINKKTNT